MKEQFIKRILAACAAKGMPKRLSQLIAAQAMHETANFTSNVFKQNNNGFGYKYVKGAKYQVGAGRISTEKDPYANYLTLEDSVYEICDWIKRRQAEGKFPANLFTIKDGETYATLLKNCGYYGGPLSGYIAGLNKYVKDVETLFA